MGELRRDILEQLRCFECNNYLSHPPIRLREDGKSICGRCPIFPNEGGISIHNKPFEIIASTLTFPCRYEMAGCKKKVLWEQVTEHELDCVYRQICCPSTPHGRCKWYGNRSGLLKHYDEKHPEMVMPHPCSPKPSIESNSEDNLLMMAYGFLFLVQLKFSTAASKLWYNVQYMGKQSFASVFEFQLKMTGKKNESIVKCAPVRPQDQFTMHRENSVEIDAKQLQRFLGDYQNIGLTLEIKIKQTKCIECKKDITSFPMYLDISGTFCEKCKTENCTEVQEKPLYPCKYTGCTHFGTAESMPKHELWLCTLNTNPCCLCQVQFRNRSMIEHWKVTHVQSVHCSDTMVLDGLKMKTLYVAELNVYDAIFFCWWQYLLSGMEFKVVSNLPKEKIVEYVSKVKLSLAQKPIILKENYFDHHYDWSIDNKKDNNHFGMVDKYSIEFTVKRKDEEAKNKLSKDRRKSKGASLFYFK